MEHVVIVGAGQAGASLAMRLRAGGYAGPLTMLGEEPYPPYQRPPLSKKYLGGEWERERLYLRPESFWDDSKIEILTGSEVTAIDLGKKTVAFGGKHLSWSKLALATGTAPRSLPEGFAGRRNVHELRSMDDVERLRDDFKPGRRILIVGGGFIGLETAAVAATAGLEVTVVERASRILERVACRETSDYIRKIHQDRGVRIIEGGSVARTFGADSVSAVELDDGTRIEMDLAVVGIGVLPRTRIAENAGIRCANGIIVDAYGRTSAADVWAAGDCAAFPFDGLPTRLESVQNAVDQAEIVADDMLGKARPYAPVPWFWSDQYEMKLQIVGLNRGYDRVVPRNSERGISNWYLREDRLIAVDTINDARTYMAVRKLLEKGVKLNAETVSNPDFDPVALLRA